MRIIKGDEPGSTMGGTADLHKNPSRNFDTSEFRDFFFQTSQSDESDCRICQEQKGFEA